VHHAVRELRALRHDRPNGADFANEARGLKGLDTLLRQRIDADEEHIDNSHSVNVRTRQELVSAFAGMKERIGSADVESLATQLQEELGRLQNETLELSKRAMEQAVGPWAEQAQQFREACAAQIASLKTLAALVERVPPLVMVVDDDEMQREIVSEVLENQYRVISATNGRHALSLMRERHPDLVLLDVMMPEMDGLEVLLQMHESPELAAIPVIMLSGRSEKDTVVTSLTAGVRDFIVKPFSASALLAKVQKFLAEHRRH
jgi:CheY-like chemotaxis protein